MNKEQRDLDRAIRKLEISEPVTKINAQEMRLKMRLLVNSINEYLEFHDDTAEECGTRLRDLTHECNDVSSTIQFVRSRRSTDKRLRYMVEQSKRNPEFYMSPDDDE